MPGAHCMAYATRASAMAAALAVLPFAFAALAPTDTTAQPNSREITVTVHRVKALDAADALSKADFYARVTIDGDAQVTPRVRQEDENRPDWKISKRVGSGRHKVKLELFDKDVSIDDPIDINKVDNKRDLDFTVDTGGCHIEGFSNSYRCGSRITRAGTERKRAEITFSVNVKRR